MQGLAERWSLIGERGPVKVAAFMGQQGSQDKVRLSLEFPDLYAQESRRFALWIPVLLGVGIWMYFELRVEPDPAWALLPIGPLALGVIGRRWWGDWRARVLLGLMLLPALGFSVALLAARAADAPVIPYPLGETVEGRVLERSRSASGAPRILLDDVTIYGVERSQTPMRVRLTVIDRELADMPLPGTRVRTYATLLPPGEPVEPGGFDFRRRAFFDRLGGTGLVRGHIIELPEQSGRGLFDRFRIFVADARARLSDGLRSAMPGRTGAFAAAIVVGDRADIQEADAEALRISNLAHLLAISGLHMGILTGLIFAIVRFGLAAVPAIALRWPTKKLAAVAAIAVGLAYLALSGATVATQRAFVMVAVALTAVLLDRPAITLRALALAATIILLLRPISLLEAGFQMSFAATAALVSGFDALRRWQAGRERIDTSKGPILLRCARIVALYVGGLLAASLLAGLATAPISAFHFNRTAPYGLIANLAAVPAMGMLIAPMACIAAVLAPFGIAGPALAGMGAGIEWVLTVAHAVARLPGASEYVAAAPVAVLGLFCVGGLWLMIWRGRMRFAAVPVLGLALALWIGAPPRPELLIAPGGKLIGFLGPEGRALDKDRAQSFAAKSWLRRDGDGAEQAEAASRIGLEHGPGWTSGTLANGWTFEARYGRKVEPADLEQLCKPRVLLIARDSDAVDGPCYFMGERELRRAGAVAIWSDGADLRIVSSRPRGRGRLWQHQR